MNWLACSMKKSRAGSVIVGVKPLDLGVHVIEHRLPTGEILLIRILLFDFGSFSALAFARGLDGPVDNLFRPARLTGQVSELIEPVQDGANEWLVVGRPELAKERHVFSKVVHEHVKRVYPLPELVDIVLRLATLLAIESAEGGDAFSDGQHVPDGADELTDNLDHLVDLLEGFFEALGLAEPMHELFGPAADFLQLLVEVLDPVERLTDLLNALLIGAVDERLVEVILDLIELGGCWRVRVEPGLDDLLEPVSRALLQIGRASCRERVSYHV